MYKAGYDPTASIDIFERIESLQKTRPGLVARVFSSHPMTFDRIREAQKNINEILPNKPEYVVNTSEFNEMRAGMIALHRRLKKEAADSSKPTLRQAPGSQPKTEDGADEPPVLKRQLAEDEL
jgi:predicted Zn-dependent protease